ncbi:hypothetical protein BASA81_007897 [Batrachochytrium salamandrivorans]|nr:hypothetical protein BASA81_007897 [Batrachochytrium salamandrivorans]
MEDEQEQQVADLEHRVAQDPTDAQAWETLVSVLPTPDRKRQCFEKLLSLFPLAHKQWVKYMEYESDLAQASGDLQQQPKVKDLLKRTLKTSYSVEVFQFYLGWLERVHSGEGFDKKRQLITDAYEEALTQIGLAIDSFPIWQMYLDFLQGMPEVESYDASIKLVAIRKVYQRGIVVAMRDVDLLFKQYLQFEQRNPQKTSSTSGGPDEHKEHVNASLVMKERELCWRHLDAPGLLPSNKLTAQQVELWIKMIQFELTNPENLKPFQFKLRMRLSFRRAVAVCWFHLEVWFAFYEFERHTDEHQAAVIVLQLALVALPRSNVARLVLADLLESTGSPTLAKQEYETLLMLNEDGGAQTSLLFIQFMRFTHRQFGLRASRDVFRRARAQVECTPQVYVAMSQLELLKSNVQVAKQVFELAMKRFPKDPLLCSEFLHFMQTRVLDYTASKQAFERICQVFDGEDDQATGDTVDALFGFYLQYQAFERDSNRDVNEMLALQHRIAKRFPNRTNPLQLTLKRYVPAIPLTQEGLVLMQDGDDDDDYTSGTVFAKHQQTNRKTSKLQAIKDMGKVPPFLRKLASIVPKKMNGMVDVDLVIRNLTQGSLPLAPTSSLSSSNTAMGEPTRKRQMGVDGAPMDAFKQRKERRI